MECWRIKDGTGVRKGGWADADDGLKYKQVVAQFYAICTLAKERVGAVHWARG
jgi:hypothetical protein